MSEEKNPVGRPSEYNPQYCEKIVDLMKDGASIEEVAAELGISKQSIYTWSEKYPDFMDAKKKAEELSSAWWMKQGRIALREKEFNYTGWYMNMKNRFGWRDKQETDITSKGNQIVGFNYITPDGNITDNKTDSQTA